MKRVLLSRASAVVLLILTTVWDAGATYLTLGHRLDMDGNPFIRGMDWKGVALIQVIVGVLVVAFFLATYGKQRLFWPGENVGFMGFIRRCVKENVSFKLKFSLGARETVYIGQVLLWTLISAHAIAALITTVPLLGGPSFLSVARLLGATAVRYSQSATTLFIVAGAIVCGHVPLYHAFLQNREEARQ
jgi:hypothetical protein